MSRALRWISASTLLPPDDAARFKADIAGSERVLFDELGHVPHEEDPARTVQPVLRFIGP